MTVVTVPWSGTGMGTRTGTGTDVETVRGFVPSAVHTLLASQEDDDMTTSHDLDRELNDMADSELRRDPNGDLGRSMGWESTSSNAGNATRPSRPVTVRPQIQDALNDDKNLAVLTHLGTIAAAVFTGGFLDVIVPAVAYVTLKDKSEMLRSHIKEQLNFQLTMLMVTVIGVLFSVITLGIGALVAVPVIVFFFIADIVCSIIAAVKASHGESYKFPFTIDFVK
jgi:uncharacterized protein